MDPERLHDSYTDRIIKSQSAGIALNMTAACTMGYHPGCQRSGPTTAYGNPHDPAYIPCDCGCHSVEPANLTRETLDAMPELTPPDRVFTALEHEREAGAPSLAAYSNELAEVRTERDALAKIVYQVSRRDRAWTDVAEEMWALLGRVLAPSAGLSNQELKEEIRTAMVRFEALRFPAGDAS